MLAEKIASVSPVEAAAQQHTRLVDAAQQFEAIFLNEILKSLQSKDGGWGEDDSQGGEGSQGTLASYGTESVAKAIARAGGLGIARTVIQKVSHQAAKTLSTPDGTKV